MNYRTTLTSLIAISAFIASPSYAQPEVTDAAAAQPDADDATTAEDSDDTVIVTGTRQTGITVEESMAPIKLVGAEAIEHVGQPNLNQALAQLVPSFRAADFGTDIANLVRSASLRGLSPNETLVLVNGKRRHGTANLAVGSSPQGGGAAPDLDFIAPASVGRIEVLEEGAAAQYGSDAIAGVINIILKNQNGGGISAQAGEHYTRGGRTYSASANYGVKSDRGYLNLTAFYRKNDGTIQGGQDIRALAIDGTIPANLFGALLTDYQSIPNYPNVSPPFGKPASRFGTASYNAGYEISDDIEFYSFGTIGFRNAESLAGFRTPNRVVRTNRAGVGTADYNNLVATNPSAIFSRQGFVPKLVVRELDQAITGGLRGEMGEWRWDLSTTYGKDRQKLYTWNSANADLFVDTGSRQTDFYVGTISNSEWTSNLDISREIGSIATLAFGAEYRENEYEISPGEPNSYYRTGAQSFPGYGPSSTGNHDRESYAVYGDVTVTPTEDLKLGAALRHEHFSDFGNTTNWKVTGRYDFTPAFALRGTASTGFRAPTLAEEWYTQVNVGVATSTSQLAANSAAAKVLGIQDLRPEKSTSFSFGTVLRPSPSLTFTVDAYQIRIRDRIVGSATIVSKSPVFAPGDLIWQAIALTNFTPEANVRTGVRAFVNGPTTRTHGIDVTASYAADLGSAGRASFTLSGAYNRTKITKGTPNPAPILAYGATLTDAQSDSFITTASPKLKVIAGVDWDVGNFHIIARQIFYSKSVAVLNNGAGVLTRTQIDATGITDLELGYDVTRWATLSIGAQNLFDKKPERDVFIPGLGFAGGGSIVDTPFRYGPYGIDGGFYYARLNLKF